jgi:hypothetical protein
MMEGFRTGGTVKVGKVGEYMRCPSNWGELQCGYAVLLKHSGLGLDNPLLASPAMCHRLATVSANDARSRVRAASRIWRIRSWETENCSPNAYSVFGVSDT